MIRATVAVVLIAGLAGSHVALAAASGTTAGQSAQKPPPAAKDVLEKALAGPLKTVDELIFVTRLPYNDGHWYANIGYYCEDANAKAYAGNGKPDAGKLCKWRIRSGKLSVLLDAQGGSLRDPQVHYDGRKILFSYRKAGSDFYHLYEIGVDGAGLTQLTSGEFDDFEPAYLPDGDILFVSTRCRRWVSCWKTHVGIMHRCRADGSDIRPVSCNIEHDNTPWVLPDGRILYTRWEYVDRSQMDFHHLWAMLPDGTGQTVFYGNQKPGIVMIDAKPIPGTHKIAASFSPGHGANEHAGRLVVLSTGGGPDDPAAVRAVSKGPLVRDPYPLSEDCFLAAQDKSILVLNGAGNSQALYTHAGPGNLHEPRPVMARAREPVLAERARPAQQTGAMLLADVYHGRNLPGVRRGDIRKLLVLEVLPKPVNFSGGMDLTSWLGTFNLERVLGTVPVEDDGSAYFEVPAGRPVFFVALDKDDLSVKRMQSFTTVMPGETQSCVGCHERRVTAPANRGQPTPLADRRPPSPIQPFDGFPSVLDFNRDIQPILDQHCVSCHSPRKREGKVLLTGDVGPNWSHSYFSLFAALQVGDGRNGLGDQPPRSIGSCASPLLKLLNGSHYDAKLSARQWRMLWLWIESGAAYAGTYAGLRNAKAEATGHGVAGEHVFGGQKEVFQRRCGQCHSGEKRRPLPFHDDREVRRKDFQRPTAIYERLVTKDDPQLRYSTSVLLNLTRPEASSLLLAPLARSAGGWEACGVVFKDTHDGDYQRLLDGIRKCKAALEAEGQFGTPQFKPNHQYVREMKRFGVLPADFDLAKDTLDVYATDEKYWRLSWYVPQRSGQE